MKNEIENIFKQKFENFEAAPSAGLFDAIVAKRAKKKRAIWIWSAAALLATVSVVSLWSLSDKTPSNFAEEKTELPQQNDLTPIVTEDIVSTDRPNEKIEEDAVVVSNNTEKSTNSSVSKQAIVKSSSTPELSKTLPKKSIEIDNKVNKPVAKENGTDAPQNEWAQLFAQIEQQNTNNDIRKGTLFLGNKKQTVDNNPEIDKAHTMTIKDESNVPSPILKKTKEEAIKIEEDENQGPFPTGKLVALSKWKIQTSAGLGYASRTLSATNKEYVQLRDNTENIATSYQLGANVIYQFAPKWNVQAGLQYTVRNEQFGYDQEMYTIENKEVTRTEIVIHPVLGEIERSYTETVADTTSRYMQTTASQNRFQTISVPLVLERNLYTAKKWSLLAKAGVLAGLYSERSGLLMSRSSEVQEYALLPTRKAGINSAMFGLGVQYHISPRVSVLAYPEANMQLNSSTKSEAGFAQKDWGVYTHFGLRIGL